MMYGKRPAQRLQMSLELGRAPGVGGGDRLGAGVKDVAGLAPPELGGRLGLEQVVEPGRSAADLPLDRNLDQLQTGDRCSNVRGSAADPLSVGQVARRRGRRREAERAPAEPGARPSPSSSSTSLTRAENSRA